jgi:hypothetical protein
MSFGHRLEWLGGLALVDVADDEAAKMWAGKMWAGKMWAGKMWAGRMWAGKRHAAGRMRFAFTPQPRAE